MKIALAVVLTIVGCVIIFRILDNEDIRHLAFDRSTETSPNQTQAAQAPLPVTKSKTFSFMPGQATNIPNRAFRKIEVRSEYPLRVLTGKCHSDYTVQFFCEGDPSDIFIVDTRKPPLILTPRANSITVTVTTF